MSVLGAVMQQIDMHNYVVTVAVVDKLGELVAHKDFREWVSVEVAKLEKAKLKQVAPKSETKSLTGKIKVL